MNYSRINKISMNDALAVSGFKCLGDLLRNVERILDCNGTAF